MGLFNKENLCKEYPTKEEYLKEVGRIHGEELKSDRYTLTYAFLTKNYWNRENKDLEKKLFQIIGTYGLEEDMFDKSIEYKKYIRSKRYNILKQFINSLSEEQINSNIFLRSTNLFIKMSNEVCSTIMAELSNKITNENVSGTITLELEIPKKIKNLIPNYICDQTSVKYYKPKEYRVEHINILDSAHQYIYDDYNSLVKKIGKLAEDVYYLQLNEMVFKSPNFECYHFQIYHPGYNDQFIASFFVRTKQNNKTLQENNSVTTEEFIQNTVTNFKQLLDMGLVDISVLEDKNIEHILKKENK